MRFGTEFTAAISFFSFISFATAQTAPTAVDFLDVESSENSTALAKRNPDCDFAAWQWADVDCNYKWSEFTDPPIFTKPKTQD